MGWGASIQHGVSGYQLHGQMMISWLLDRVVSKEYSDGDGSGAGDQGGVITWMNVMLYEQTNRNETASISCDTA